MTVLPISLKIKFLKSFFNFLIQFNYACKIIYIVHTKYQKGTVEDNEQIVNPTLYFIASQLMCLKW